MEYWDIYDINRYKTNRVLLRGNKLQNGDYHLVVNVCIFNSKGEMLIQQRQSFKEGWPNKWDISAGGNALKGETSQMAAERETFEELGIKLDLKTRRPHLTLNFYEGYDDVYLVEKDIEISELYLQQKEVQSVRWASQKDILQMIERDEFIPYYPNLINLLFDMRKRYGYLEK